MRGRTLYFARLTTKAAVWPWARDMESFTALMEYINVPIKKYSHGFYRNRCNQVVQLNRRINEDIKGPTAVYCCMVLEPVK